MSEFTDEKTGIIFDDSRLQRTKVSHPTLPLERTFCSFCGKPKGWVNIDTGDLIRAEHVLVVCDDCSSKLDAKFGKPPLEEAQIPEYNIIDAMADGTPVASGAFDWIENCPACKLPMVKLQPVPQGFYKADMGSLRTGEVLIDEKKAEVLARAQQTAAPEWFCKKCKSLWGAVDMFWCKFRKVTK